LLLLLLLLLLQILEVLALLIQATQLVTQRGQLLIDAAKIADLLVDRGQIVVVARGLQQHL